MCVFVGRVKLPKYYSSCAHLAPIKAVATLRNPMELWVNRSIVPSMLQFTLMQENTHTHSAQCLLQCGSGGSLKHQTHIFFLLSVWSVPRRNLEPSHQYELY